MKRLFAVWMALVLVFAAGCGKAGEPGTTSGEESTTTTADTDTSTTAGTEDSAPAEYDMEAIREKLQAELAADNTPKKIVDCTRYGNYLFVFCDPVPAEGESEDIFGGWLHRYNLKTGTLERHYTRLPLSRYIILSETRVVGEGGRPIGFEPFMPGLYDLTFTEEGLNEHYIEKAYYAAGEECASLNYTVTPCSLERADADAGSFTFLYGRAEGVGIGSGIPSAAWKISVSDGVMTVLFEDMERGKLSLGDLNLSNVFFESAELTEIEGKTAFVLKLTKYARYFAVEEELIVSPETFPDAQYWYSMMRIAFTAGEITGENVLEWAARYGSFESYMERLDYTDAVLVTLPRNKNAAAPRISIEKGGMF